MTRTHHIFREQFVPRRLDEVFGFFLDAGNLEEITPPFLHFKILTPRPIEMRAGTRIDYRLRLHGFPIRWQTRIEEVDPGVRFVDTQVRGPYRLWRHVHEFRESGQGTLVTDSVRYEIGWSLLGELAGLLFVHRSLARIFDYRRLRIEELLGPAAPPG